MNWVDFLSLGVIVVVTIVFTIRGRDGMGIALFDMSAFVASAWLAHKFYDPLGNGLGVSPWIVYVVMFIALDVLLLFVSSRLFGLTQWNFSPFNGLLSFFFGIAAGWAITYVMLEVIALNVTPTSSTGSKVMESKVATEILQFRTVTGTKALLDSARFHEREPWELPGGPKPSEIR